MRSHRVPISLPRWCPRAQWPHKDLGVLSYKKGVGAGAQR